MKRLRLGLISIVIVLVLTVCECIPLYAYAVEKKEYDVYCVSIRANFRAKATKNSRWIMTIPTGVFVVIEGALTNSYYKAHYGEYEGYIYKGCIKKTDDCTYENYKAQFPELFGNELPENANDTMLQKRDIYANTKEIDGKVKYTGGVKSGTKKLQNEYADNISNNDLVNDDKNDTEDVSNNDLEMKKYDEAIGPIKKPNDKSVSDNDDDKNTDDKESNDKDVLGKAEDKIGKNDSSENSINESSSPSAASTNEIDDNKNNSDSLGISDKKDAKTKNDKSQNDFVESKVLAQSNLRNAPSIEGDQVILIPMGATVKVLDSGDNGYAHVMYEQTEGYIFTRCLDYKDEHDSGDGVITTVIVDELEKKSGKKSGVAYSPSAYSIQRHAVANNASIMLSDKVYSKEAPKTEEVQVDTSTVQAKSSTDALKNVEQNVIGRTANLRSVASPDSNIITTISVGTNITVLGSNAGGYTMVQYDGKIGYISEDCIVDSIDVTQFGTEPILFSVTAYCSCKICCGNYSPEVRGGEAHTATGTVPQQGRTIAVDPSVIPYGTKVYIDGYGTFVAEDCGGAIKGNHIDMYFGSHAEALAFGSKRLYCTVVTGE